MESSSGLFSKQALITHWDKVAELYDSALPMVPPEIISFIQKEFDIDRSSRILDMGCGTGWLTSALGRYSDFVEGVDLSKEMLNIAAKRYPHLPIKWIHSPIEEFNIAKESYELISSFESFHYFKYWNPYQTMRAGTCPGWLSSSGVGDI